jgi:hypothetical protein
MAGTRGTGAVKAVQVRQAQVQVQVQVQVQFEDEDVVRRSARAATVRAAEPVGLQVGA